MICDWCGEKQPTMIEYKKNYHTLVNYVHKPNICKDCYRQMKRQKRHNFISKNQS